MTKAGFVTLVGRPNAGKSTLLNRLVGERLAIVSPKPQSTRDRVVGILSDADTQLVFLDTPGLLEPRYDLQRAMQHAAELAITDADVLIHLVDANDEVEKAIAEFTARPRKSHAPLIRVLNKVDRLDGGVRMTLEAAHPEAAFVSAETGEGVAELLSRVRAVLPEHPFLYDAEDVSTQQMRFFVREFLRETVLEHLEDELPYGIAVEIEEYREGKVPVYIRAVMHVERESQKRIVIGAGGSRIREIGKATRAKIEPLVGGRVFLDLWVKVLPNWRRNAAALARLGYRLPDSTAR